MTDDPDLRIATSLVDYLFRKLAIEYLPYETRRDIGVLTVGERTQPTLPGVEEAPPRPSRQRRLPLEDRAPSAALPPSVDPGVQRRRSETVLCHICGDIMQRAGSCHACPSCGATSGARSSSNRGWRRSPAACTGPIARRRRQVSFEERDRT